MKGTTASSASATSHLPAAGSFQYLSRLSMGGVCLFLLISTFFFSIRQIDLLAPLGEGLVRQLLGNPPPPPLTALALLGYTLSAAILIVHRAVQGEKPVLKWIHVFYRTVFFPFFLFAGALGEYFMGVFIAGLGLTALEYWNIWSFCRKTLPGKAGVLGRI